jgi:hypothetical protein
MSFHPARKAPLQNRRTALDPKSVFYLGRNKAFHAAHQSCLLNRIALYKKSLLLCPFSFALPAAAKNGGARKADFGGAARKPRPAKPHRWLAYSAKVS